MSRLEEILQKHEDKNEMHFFQIDKETIIIPAVEEYVKECVKASLEKASENGLVKHSFPGNSETSKAIGDGNQVFTVDKKSITQESNIVLL